MINEVGFFVYKIIIALLPLAAVIVLGRIAWILWVHYVQQDFISGIDFVLLEIVPPREVLRSPKAMEKRRILAGSRLVLVFSGNCFH